MNLLLISYPFPPIPYGGTYRALRLCKKFVDQYDIDCHVLTLKIYKDIPNDFELLKKIPDAVSIYRVPIIDPWRKYQVIKTKFIHRTWFKAVNKIFSFCLRFITFPDHMLLWIPFAVLKARRVIRKHKIQTILVSSPPDSSQLIGLILKKWFKIRWIADFRDPIYGNVAQVNMITPSNLLDKLHKNLLAKYDRLIAMNADILISNTATHAKQLQQNYGCSNIKIIRNSYDPSDYTNITKDKFPILTIAHVGSIYGKRNPDVLFAAIKQLADEYAPDLLRIQIIFIGLGGNVVRENINRYNIEKYVKIIGQLPHQKALEYMCRSHLLLLIKATGKWSYGQIPGKFFEYIGSHNPVLCIGPQKSEVADLIRDNKLGYVVENDFSKMVSVLSKVYEQYLTTGTTPALTERQVAMFSSETMAKKMYQMFV